MHFLPFVIAVGFLLSSYAFYVEFKFNEAQRLGLQYRALCDIGMFSCTKVFSSDFGHLSKFFGLPAVSNAAIGMAFYLFEMLIERRTTLLLLTSGASCIGSIGLFYILTVILNDFCIVCFSIYVVNFTTFLTCLRRYRRAAQKSTPSGAAKRK
jgi:vitamin-K-epoxide reductase (warfarin-sensitive)